MITNPLLDGHVQAAKALVSRLSPPPADYGLTDIQLINHDDLVAFGLRYTRKNGICSKLGGEHYSVSVDMDAQKILGVMHVERRHTGGGLPDHDTAREQALGYLERTAPGLQERLELKWILPLREQPESPPRDSPFPFTDDDGILRFVTGIRVKFFCADNKKWTWVIVGRNREIVAFERDIIWNSVLGRRSTPAWLHDDYVIAERERLQSM